MLINVIGVAGTVLCQGLHAQHQLINSCFFLARPRALELRSGDRRHVGASPSQRLAKPLLSTERASECAWVGSVGRRRPLSLDGTVVFFVVDLVLSVADDVFLGGHLLLSLQVLVPFAALQDVASSTALVEVVLRFGEVGDVGVARRRRLSHVQLLLCKHLQVAGRSHVHKAVGLLVHLHLAEVVDYGVGSRCSLGLRFVVRQVVLLLL